MPRTNLGKDCLILRLLTGQRLHLAASTLPECSDERSVAQQPLTVEWVGNTSLRTTRHSAFLQEEVAKCLTVMQHSRIQRCCSERWFSGCQTSEHSVASPFSEDLVARE